jgi:hypothetical protein
VAERKIPAGMCSPPEDYFGQMRQLRYDRGVMLIVAVSFQEDHYKHLPSQPTLHRASFTGGETAARDHGCENGRRAGPIRGRIVHAGLTQERLDCTAHSAASAQSIWAPTTDAELSESRFFSRLSSHSVPFHREGKTMSLPGKG